MKNDVVEKKTRLIWLKLIEVVSYWHQFPKNKQLGLGKPGVNLSYGHICKAVKDCLVPVKVLSFEEVAKKLYEFQVVFQTDKPVAPILMETLKGVIQALMEKVIWKDFCDKLFSEMAKLYFNEVNNQKPTYHVDLGFHES